MERNLTFYTFYYLISLIAMRVCGILAKILLARSITPYEYGLITLIILTIPNFLQFITNFCFYDILGHATDGRKYLSFSMIYGVLTTAILASVFLLFQTPIFTYLNIPSEYWELSYFIIFIVLLSITIRSIISGFLRGIRKHAYAATLSAEPSILRVLFIGIAVYLFGINNFYWIIILFALPPLLTIIPVIIMKFNELGISLKKIEIPNSQMMVFGLSFFILNLWLGVTQQINSLIISHELGITWQGYFDVSLSAVAVITFFSSAIYLISAPETTNDNNRSELLSKRGGFGDIGKILFSLCLLCVIIIFFYSHEIINLLFTEKYSVAGDYLIILAIGYTILFIQQYSSYLTISAEGKKGLTKLSLITAAGLVLLPILTHFMICYLGFLGAYLSIAIFIVYYTIATILISTNRIPLLLLSVKADRLFLSVLGTFLILYVSHFSFIPGTVISVLVFTTLILLLGYIESDTVLIMIGMQGKKA